MECDADGGSFLVFVFGLDLTECDFNALRIVVRNESASTDGIDEEFAAASKVVSIE